MYPNDLGAYAAERMDKITEYSGCATVVNQIIMPNHVHAIIELNNDTTDYQPNRFGPLLEKSLSSVLNHYKGRITKYANENNLHHAWQARFHDHIIRNFAEYQRIFDYITDNPQKWTDDKFYKK